MLITLFDNVFPRTSICLYQNVPETLCVSWDLCVSLCVSDETLKAVGPFYLVSMPGEVKYPTQGVECLNV